MKIDYSVSRPYENIIFVEMRFFDGDIPLQVSDPSVEPIYNILLRYDLRGDLGFKMVVTTGASLNDTCSLDNLMSCFKELEVNGYLDAKKLENEISPCHVPSFKIF